MIEQFNDNLLQDIDSRRPIKRLWYFKMHIRKFFMVIAVVVVSLISQSAQAQTLLEQWTYGDGSNGFGLSPLSYGGAFRPVSLAPDTGYSYGATITGLDDYASGGLGSSTYIDGYGGIYTFFYSIYDLTLTSGTILTDLDQITISIVAGGGNPDPIDYDASSLVLNYNSSYTNLISSSFTTTALGYEDSPVGPQLMTQFTWTWSNLSTLGTTTEFSTSWGVQGTQHVFFSGVSVEQQAIPEPSVLGLIFVAGVFTFIYLRRKRQNFSECKIS